MQEESRQTAEEAAAAGGGAEQTRQVVESLVIHGRGPFRRARTPVVESGGRSVTCNSSSAPSAAWAGRLRRHPILAVLPSRE